MRPGQVVPAVAPAAVGALTERLALLAHAFPGVTPVVLDGPGAAHLLARARAGALPYLLDVNAATSRVAARLRAAGRPYVVDTGDDAGALQLASGGSRSSAAGRRAVEGLVLWGARAVVCRGYYHREALVARTRAPVAFVPDTAPDSLLDDPPPPGDPSVVASFGSMGLPTSGDRTYGWEVVDLVAAAPGLRGVLVGAGPGLDALRARADRLGVGHRISFTSRVPLPELLALVGAAGWLTSVQSDDPAGWVRTTGKLPLGLGARRAVLATRVGEAARVLPEPLLVDAGSDEVLVAAMSVAVRAGVPAGWPATAATLAERYRRSVVASELRTAVEAAL